jgi:hypothetical protein
VWGTGQLVLLCPCVAPNNRVPHPRSEIKTWPLPNHISVTTTYAARVTQSQKHVLAKCSQNIATSSVELYISGSMASVPGVDCHHPDQLKTNQRKDALVRNLLHLVLCCLVKAERPSYHKAQALLRFVSTYHRAYCCLSVDCYQSTESDRAQYDGCNFMTMKLT